MARLPKDFLATGFRGNREKKSVAPHYLSEPFTSALAPLCGPLDFFCHIIWRQREGSTKRAKRGKKATPRYVAEPFASLRCIDKGFRGICATLSGGNPPRYGSCPLLVIVEREISYAVFCLKKKKAQKRCTS